MSTLQRIISVQMLHVLHRPTMLLDEKMHTFPCVSIVNHISIWEARDVWLANEIDSFHPRAQRPGQLLVIYDQCT